MRLRILSLTIMFYRKIYVFEVSKMIKKYVSLNLAFSCTDKKTLNIAIWFTVKYMLREGVVLFLNNDIL